MMSADLHCHSICSDGATSVKNVIELASLIGLKALALTDHDTFMGIEKAHYYGRKYGVSVVVGAEISAYDFDRNRLVHILCYNCQKPELLTDTFNKIAVSRKNAMDKAMVEITKHYNISMEMVQESAKESSTIFKSHIMHALMLAGYTEKFMEIYIKRFLIGKQALQKQK